MPSKKSQEPIIEGRTNPLLNIQPKPTSDLTVLEREFEIWEDPKKPQEGNPLRFFFRLGKDGKPVKLGDGSYGVVYEVLEKGADEHKPGKRFAVKLLYSARANVHNISTVPPDDLGEKYSSLFQGKPSYEELISRLKELEYDKEAVLELFKLLGNATPKFAKERFEQEIKATTTIRNARPGQFYRVVDIKGGTESFRGSDAYKNLSAEFSSGGFTVSDYALVMQLYDYTLKDLLENGKTGHYQMQIPEKENPLPSLSEEMQTTLGRQIKSSQEELLQELAEALGRIDENIKKDLFEKAKALIVPLSGYDLLKRLDFNERIRSILPIILDITRGVETIHFAKKRHRDLKPANVYLQVSEDKHSLKADIGDLGFIDTDVHVGGSKAEFNVSEVLAFGTYHYRSPEQKDYFDVCEVAVYSNENRTTSLIIKDPKFRNTIIEKGDFVIFSKDDNKTRYTICNDPVWGNQQRDAVTIELKSPQTVVKPPPKDEKTQVFFFKSQQVRTDMFGVGALIYDLVTAGESPERFYDEIRSFDKESGSVENLMRHYGQLYEFEPPDQSFVNIFRPFRHPDRREYVPTKLVEIILKCMLYKVKDSYYGQLGENAITLALTDLRSMEKEPYLTKGGNINPLLGGDFNITPTLSRDKRLDKTISELQQQHFIKRIPHAYTYLFQLYKRIEDSVTGDNKNKAFFIQLLPESVSNEERRLAYENVIQYANEQDYHADLLANGVSKISRNIMNPFVPDYLKFMQRRVKITPFEKDSVYYRVSFQDTAWTGDMIKVGDWIRIEKETSIQLFRVASIKDDIVALEQELLNDGRKEKQNKDGEKTIGSSNLTIEETLDGLFIQSLDPAKYYSHLLGIYLYQMFFVGIRETPKSTLPLIYTLKGYYPLTNDGMLIAIGDALLGQGPVDDVLSLLSNIYLKLILTEYSGSYWKESGGEILKMIVNIRKDLRKLADLIAENLYENFTPDITLGLIELKNGAGEKASPSFSPSRVLIDQIKLKPVADLKDIFGFWQRQYMLAVNVRGMGQVLPKPKATYLESEMVTLTAEADDGWQFAKWVFDDQQFAAEVDPIQTSISFPMDGNRIVTAVFVSDQAILKEKKFVLKMQLEDEQGGMIRVEPEQEQYDWGKRVYLTAKEHEGFEFVGWKSNSLIGGIDHSISFFMQEDVTITAVFKKRKYHLFVQSEGGGTIDPEPKGAGFEYEYGTQVVLKAIQKETQFLGWEKDGIFYSNDLTLDFPIKDNMSLLARFVKDEKYILSIEVVGEGFGKVTRSVEGPAYKPGTYVNIKAIAKSKGWGGNYTFMGWSGDYEGTNPNPVIKVTKNMHIIARFD